MQYKNKIYSKYLHFLFKFFVFGETIEVFKNFNISYYPFSDLLFILKKLFKKKN